MSFFKKPAEYWTFDAIAVHYYDNDICRTLDNIKKDLQRRAKMEDHDAQKAEELLVSDWKKLVTTVKTHATINQMRSEATISTFADGSESMSKVRKAILNDIDDAVTESVIVPKDYEKNREALMSNSAPAYINDNSGYEEKDINLVRKRKNDGETTPTKRTKSSDNISMDSDFTFFSVESINYDGGLGNYEEGTEIDLDLSFQETDEDLTIPSSERLFNENIWRQWRLGSGKVVTDLLAKFANKTGHPLRPEVWGIVRCGFRIAKPEWCDADEYSEIQKYVRRATISSCPESISKLLKLKSLEFLKREMEKIQVLINTNEIDNENNDSVVQQPNMLESDYGGYIIHPSLKCMLSGLEKFKSCRERRRCTTLFEQKADGVFVIRLKKSSVEVGHLEMSGGHGHKDFSRSTWDGCCKLPIGNAYMLEEIGEKFRENRIELWRMYVPSCGVLQYERTHRATVPICFEEERKCIFNFVVVLWDLRCWLLEVFELIYKLLEEHNDSDVNESNLHSGILPPHPFTPQKDKHKK
ncbi:9525_t:CDS:10, partial [Diversispora eburnea]